MVKNLIFALRLPFATASILPFVFGSLIIRNNFNYLAFILGLLAVAFTHLSANLINDYADSQSKADWQDKKSYIFFGGSKLIQAGVFSEGFYLKAAAICAAVSCLSSILLALFLKSPLVIAFYAIIIVLSWQYSKKPLQFSYRRLGEIFIFLLFGPALVEGGYFIQTGIFPDMKSFLLSVPFGLLTLAILFANEIPDYFTDNQTGKMTWVSLTGEKKAFLLYGLFITLAFLSIILNVSLRYIKPWALLSLIFLPIAKKATQILRVYPCDKMRLMQSSKLTINLQIAISVILILALL